MAAWGLYAEEPLLAPWPEFYLWPENVEAWALFMACGGEWRSGTAGREGLDKYGVEVVMRDIVGIRPQRRRQRMREIHLMEQAALHEWALERNRGK